MFDLRNLSHLGLQIMPFPLCFYEAVVVLLLGAVEDLRASKTMEMVMKILVRFVVFLSVCGIFGCSSSDVDDAIDVIQDPPRKQIDYGKLGLNSFVNDGRFGSIRAQLREVRTTLGVRHVRVLFAWEDRVQPIPGGPINFSFYDEILAALPADVDVLVVLAHVPSWMSNSGNWVEGNPRTSFVELWVRRVLQRYGNNPQITGFQIWNEPNAPQESGNSVLNVDLNPSNYVEMLARAYSVVKDIAPGKLVVNAATTAINQNYPDSIKYNRDMRSAGIEQFIDVFAVHYYGEQFENVVRKGGVRDFLNGIGRPIWLTESGEQGLDRQLEYVERTWPFLTERIPGIDRIYYYQHTEASPADVSFGLRNLERVSDLFLHLRDRAK